MAGNVWEWTASAFKPYPGGQISDNRFQNGNFRVIRGGGYNTPAAGIRTVLFRFPSERRDHLKEHLTNYRGLVFAHLARHKQFPADARGRGEQGSAMIGFSLDGGGRVTRVSLVRSSGFPSLDQEAQAMVRRASPFPAPPDGRAVSFTAPASFRIQ